MKEGGSEGDCSMLFVVRDGLQSRMWGMQGLWQMIVGHCFKLLVSKCLGAWQERLSGFACVRENQGATW